MLPTGGRGRVAAIEAASRPVVATEAAAREVATEVEAAAGAVSEVAARLLTGVVTALRLL